MESGRPLDLSLFLDVLQTLERIGAPYVVIGAFAATVYGVRRATYDIDIVVEMPPDAYQMVHMKDELEELLLGSVDLVRYNKYLNTRLRERIDREAIYV